MSKKGKKVDTSLFFNSNSTGISEISSSNKDVDKFNNRRYDSRNSDRPQQRRYDQQDRPDFEKSSVTESDGNWRRTNTVFNSQSTSQSSLLPTRRVAPNSSNSNSSAVDDKFGMAFSTGSKWGSKSLNNNNADEGSKSTATVANQSVNTNEFETNDLQTPSTKLDSIKYISEETVSKNNQTSESDKWSNVFGSKTNRPSKTIPIPRPTESLDNNSKNNNFSNKKIINELSTQGGTDKEEVDSKQENKESYLDKKKALRAEVAKKSKEAKESLAQKHNDEKKRLELLEAESVQQAKDILKSGLKGDELASHIQSQGIKLSGSTLLKEILASLEDPLSLKWCSKSEYAPSLKQLLQGNDKAQVLAILAIQLHCFKLNFPKIEIKGSSRNLIEVIFQLCYQNDIIENSGFLSWLDDDSEPDSKTKALFQVNQFIAILKEEDSAEEEEEEDIDEPLPTVP